MWFTFVSFIFLNISCLRLPVQISCGIMQSGGILMKKIIIAILCFIAITALCIAFKLFLIGEPVDGNSVLCHVSENDNQVNISIALPESATAFTGASLRQKGSALYITMRKVLVSPLFSSGTHQIWIEKNDLTEIYFGGRKIWSAE